MTALGMSKSRRFRPLWLLMIALVIAGGVTYAVRARNATPSVPTALVTRGEFVNYLAMRGEIRAVREVVISAPAVPTDLQVLHLVKNGAPVKQGEVLTAFDTTDLQRQLEQHDTDVKQADAQVERIKAQARLQEEQDQTDLAAAKFNVERARLDAGKQEILSQIDGEKAKLALADAQQALAQAEQKLQADRTGFAADIDAQRQKREKSAFDRNRYRRWISMMELRAPHPGMVTLENNTRFGGPGMAPPLWKEGDKAWQGAPMVTLPEVSAGLRFEASVEEADRGQLRDGQAVTVRVDAVPDREFAGAMSEISPLTKPDFSTWPPLQNFIIDVNLSAAADPRLRPGMSAGARVSLERIPNAVLVPAEAVFQRAGHNVVYVLRGSAFDERPIEIAHRTREKVAIASGVAPGEKVATRDPFADTEAK